MKKNIYDYFEFTEDDELFIEKLLENLKGNTTKRYSLPEIYNQTEREEFYGWLTSIILKFGLDEKKVEILSLCEKRFVLQLYKDIVFLNMSSDQYHLELKKDKKPTNWYERCLEHIRDLDEFYSLLSTTSHYRENKEYINKEFEQILTHKSLNEWRKNHEQ